MSRSFQVKVALVALLVGAWLAGQVGIGFRPADVWYSVGLMAFGITNVLLTVPGTRWVRGIAIGATLISLAWPGMVGVTLVLAWLAWPPAILLAWALDRHSSQTASAERPEGDAAALRARVTLAVIIAAVAVASFVYRLLVTQGLQQTAALFVGIPALLAILVLFGIAPRSATGVACKAVTVGLLVSLLFLGEGVLCVVMSAPLFYLIAVVIAAAWNRAHRAREKSTTMVSCAIVLAMVPMSMEGVTDFTTLNREESVARSKVVRASSQDVERALFEQPRFDRVRPFYLRAGFPSPLSTRIERDADRTRWVIQLRGGEMRLSGMEPRTGDLILDLKEAGPGLVRWRAVSDTSHLTHFLTWREIVVQWEPVDVRSTRVTWTLRYRRGLDPAWYFGPMERYAARLAAGYLIDSVATP